MLRGPIDSPARNVVRLLTKVSVAWRHKSPITGKKHSKQRMNRTVELPYDVLLTICMHLDVDSIVSLSQVSRFYREVMNARSIWYGIALRFQRRSRLLVLDDLVHPGDLDIENLKRVVIRTSRLESNWTKTNKSSTVKAIKPLASIRSMKIQPHDFDVHRLLQNAAFYISDEFLVMPSNTLHLVIFDLINNRMIDSYKLFNFNRGISIRLHHASRTLYAIVGKTWFSNTWSERFGLSILSIKLPYELSYSPYSGTAVNHIATYRFSYDWRIIMVLQDATHERFSILFRPDRRETAIKLLLFPDWERSSVVIYDTGIGYRDNVTGASLWYSPEGDFLYVYISFLTEWTSCRFSISEARQYARDWDAAAANSGIDIALLHEVEPIETISSLLNVYLKLTEDIALVHYWNLSQWWQKFDNIPSRCSHFCLYRRDSSWFITQHYTSGHERLSDYPLIFWLGKNVMLQNHLERSTSSPPLLGLSFNHMAWIERESSKTGSLLGLNGRSTKLVLRILSFPEPGAGHPDVEHLIQDLVVPEKILVLALHLFIEPALGSVVILASNSEIYKIPFA